jgi:hypothetical protein
MAGRVPTTGASIPLRLRSSFGRAALLVALAALSQPIAHAAVRAGSAASVRGAANAQIVAQAAAGATSGTMTEDQAQMAARYEECRKKLQEGQKSGLITALRLKPPAIEVDVEATAWNQIPYEGKLTLVQTISCFAVAGNPKLQARVQMLDSRNHSNLGYFDGTTLKIP